MLDDLEELNLKLTPGMYNAIMAECFQEVFFLVTEDASVFARIDFPTSPNWHFKLGSTHFRLQFTLTPNLASLTLKISHFSTYNSYKLLICLNCRSRRNVFLFCLQKKCI